jgi:hypothetical protein
MATGGLKSGAKKVGEAAKSSVETAAQKAGAAATDSKTKVAATLKDVKGPSPNPMTNLIIADIALRGGGRLLRHMVERSLLGVKYPKAKASQIVKGRGMTQTLLGTAVARIATRSVPGALLVGGSLIAKTLYDRAKTRQAKAEGQQDVEEQAKAGRTPT